MTAESDNSRGEASGIPFYVSEEQACPYLPGQVERKIFTILPQKKENRSTNSGVHAVLAEAGFRRSFDMVYRPACPACSACVPLRVPVDRFVLKDSQRRVLKRHHNVRSFVHNHGPTHEHFQLFQSYQRRRHPDGDMAAMGWDAFLEMMTACFVDMSLLEVRRDTGALCGVMAIDWVGEGLSAVYSFYDGHDPKESWGQYLILQAIELARQRKLAYVYLGYWIDGCRKMAYKTAYAPHQTLGASGWREGI